MEKGHYKIDSNEMRRRAARITQAAVLALAFVLAMPASAADNRAVKSRVAPIYPEIAKRMRIAGEVRLEVTVDPEGKVTDVKKLSGNGMLSTAAEDAVRKWKFEPGPETSTIDLTLNFALTQ